MKGIIRSMGILALAPAVALGQNVADDTGESEIKGNPKAGKAKSAVCAACHGADGNAIIAEYPDLAGQNAPYMVNALIAYKRGWRTGGNAGIMAPQAQMLSQQDMADLAAYYASLGEGDE